MPYKHGRPVIDLSFWFRIASLITSYPIVIIAMAINFIQHGTTYKHRWRMRNIKKAITVSNHTTVFDPVKIAFFILPHFIFQTMLEATVMFPYLGTFIRLLGGVPIPQGRTGYDKLVTISDKAFNFCRYLHFYPEGECFLYNQQIMKFHTGAFKLAAELNIPVLPMVTVFSGGFFRPWSVLGRSLPVETLVILDPFYPSDYIRRDSKGEITIKSVREFAEAVRVKMQNEIDRRNGTSAFYRGQMERIKGLND